MGRKYSQYEETGCMPLDMVWEAVGHAKYYGKSIKRVILSSKNYAMVWAAVEIMQKRPLPEDFILTFDGIECVSGGRGMFEPMEIEYNKPIPLILN